MYIDNRTTQDKLRDLASQAKRDGLTAWEIISYFRSSAGGDVPSFGIAQPFVDDIEKQIIEAESNWSPLPEPPKD